MAENDLTYAGSNLRIGAIIQARVNSTRLPGKALLPLPLGGSTTILEQIVRRAHRANSVTEVILAIPDSAADDPLFHLAQSMGTKIIRGSEADVLDRFATAATTFGLDIIVRLTADNPAIDPVYIDEAIRAHLAYNADYTITTGLPLGTNVEVLSVSSLQKASQEAQAIDEREHVTPYLRRRPELFRLLSLPLTSGTDNLLSSLRLTVDYASDYALLHLLYTTLGLDFGLQEVLDLLVAFPWIAQLNAGNKQLQV